MFKHKFLTIKISNSNVCRNCPQFMWSSDLLKFWEVVEATGSPATFQRDWLKSDAQCAPVPLNNPVESIALRSVNQHDCIKMLHFMFHSGFHCPTRLLERYEHTSDLSQNMRKIHLLWGFWLKIRLKYVHTRRLSVSITISGQLADRLRKTSSCWRKSKVE